MEHINEYQAYFRSTPFVQSEQCIMQEIDIIAETAKILLKSQDNTYFEAINIIHDIYGGMTHFVDDKNTLSTHTIVYPVFNPIVVHINDDLVAVFKISDKKFLHAVIETNDWEYIISDCLVKTIEIY